MAGKSQRFTTTKSGPFNVGFARQSQSLRWPSRTIGWATRVGVGALAGPSFKERVPWVRSIRWWIQLVTAALVVLATAATLGASAPNNSSGYHLKRGQVFGYSYVVAVEYPGITEYQVGYAIFGVSSVDTHGSKLITAISMENSISPDAMPSSPAKFQNEELPWSGAYPRLNGEASPLRCLPGSTLENIFPPMPEDPTKGQWGDRAGSRHNVREVRYERLGSSMRVAETFMAQVDGAATGKPSESWRGSGQFHFDPKLGLVTQRQFQSVYGSRSGGTQQRVPVKLTVRMLDANAMAQVARAMSVRLPGVAPSSRERSRFVTTSPSGRWAHADTPFKTRTQILIPEGEHAYRGTIVGEAQDGIVLYRIDGSRALWDGMVSPSKVQFAHGTKHFGDDSFEIVQRSTRNRLLKELESGQAYRASRAIEQLAQVRPREPDDEMAEALLKWLGHTEKRLASPFSNAMKYWATPKVVPTMVAALTQSDGVVQRIAESGITGVGAPAERVVALLLRHDVADVRESAASLLGRIGTPGILGVLGAIQKTDPADDVRRAASFAMVQIRKRHDIPNPAVKERERERERQRRQWQAELERQRRQAKRKHDATRRKIEQQLRSHRVH